MSCPRPPWFRWWLFPVSGVVHFCDELFAGGGFNAWITHIGGARIGMARFAAATMAAFVSITIASWLSRNRYDWLLFALAAIIFANALTHLAGSLATGSYSPGTVSGLLLWLPLGGAILYRGYTRDFAIVWWAGLATGVVMNFVILLFTMNLGGMR